MTIVLFCICLYLPFSRTCFRYTHVDSTRFLERIGHEMGTKKRDDRSGVRTRATCVMGKFTQLKSHVLDHSTILPSSGVKFHRLWAGPIAPSIGYCFGGDSYGYVVKKYVSILL